MSSKVGLGAGANCALGRKILRFKTEFGNASWSEIGRRFGVSPDHDRVHYLVATEFPSAVVQAIGIYKCKAIRDGKVPHNHRRAFHSIATMSESVELRRLIHKLYGDPALRVQIDEFGCIACATPIPFERMGTMQCGKCDGDNTSKIVLKIRFSGRGELCLG